MSPPTTEPPVQPKLVEPQVSAVPVVPSARLIGRFPLVPEGTSIGRSPDNDIVIKHPTIAPHHARTVRQGKWYVVRHLGRGQTLVSFSGDPAQERPISENALKDGSSVRFGDVRCTVHLLPDGSAGHIQVPFPLENAVTTIGHDGANDIVVNVPGVASRQAEIHWEKGRYVVYEVGEGGGLLVSFSGDPGQERPVVQRNALKAGSTLRLGNIVFKLEQHE